MSIQAVPGRYSHTVALVSGSFAFCGGTLISADTVITAAHCVDDDNEFDVLINRHDLNSSDGERLSMLKKSIHPDYNSDTLDNDFAIVFLKRGTSEPVNYAKLNRDGRYPAAGTMVRTMGWGTMSNGGSTSDVLREVDLPVVTNIECSQRYPNDDISQNMICTFQPGKDACQGDSGE